MDLLIYLDDLEIEEPIGMADFELSITRDEKLHGIGFEASTSPLQFYGEAYTYLKNKKETEGVQANVILRALAACDGYDYEEVLSGRLNFGKYKELCGDQCSCSLPWESETCEVVLKSRYDQKVDLDKTTAADGITPLEEYAGLALPVEIPAKELKSAVEGYVVDEGDEIDLAIFPRNNTQDFAIRPTYGHQLSANINESQLIPTFFCCITKRVERFDIKP